MCRRSLFALGLLLVGGAAALGQVPQPQPLVPAAPVTPPLLFVRFSGPPGVKVTFYRDGPAGRTFEAPCTVGLRPGFAYRVEVSGMPRFPGVKLYPALEVRGSFVLPPSLKLSDHPAALLFRDEDFRSVLSDALVTKAVALERPDNALPLPTEANRPIEIDVPVGTDPLKAIAERGRPLLVVKFGDRKFSPEELAALSIPGTMLLPGETVLPLPRDQPWLAWSCYQLYDPKLGPASRADEICFWDGGDRGAPVGYGPDGRLLGLDASDTVAEYTDSQNQRRIAVSNRVCLCIPRFLVMRGEAAALAHVALTGPGRATLVQNQGTLLSQRQAFVETQQAHLSSLAAGQKSSTTGAVQVTSVSGRYSGLDVVARVRGTQDVSGTCAKPEAVVPERPLRIIKWPDKCGAAIGEIITFYLKYTNEGGRPVTNVVVSDSLTGRLEYVAGSARSDRDGVFTTQLNEAGSAVLRWEINEPLPPGQSGTVSFQVRVR